MTNLVRAARAILLAVGELPPNKKLIRAAFALQEALSEQSDQEKPYSDKAAMFAQLGGMVRIDPVTGDVGIGTPPKTLDYVAPVQQVTRADLKAAFKEGFESAADLYAPKDVQEQAEQEPMYISESCAERGCACHYSVEVDGEPVAVYSAPVHTKDLTDDEIKKLQHKIDWAAEWTYINFARSVIAADREKNK